MKQYSNLDVYGNIRQEQAQGRDNNDVVILSTLAPINTKPATTTGATAAYSPGQIAVVDGVVYICTAVTSSGSGSSTTWTYTWTTAGDPSYANVIETVKAEGTPLTVTNKAVDVTRSSLGLNNNKTSINGSATTIVSTGDSTYGIYGPTTAGSSGQYLKSSGSGAPGWETPISASSGVASGESKLITAGAVYDYVQSLPDPMVFKGSVGAQADSPTVEWTNLPQPQPGTGVSAGNEGWTYKVVTAYSNTGSSDYRPTCKVGDTIISTGTSWTVIPSGDEPSGTVTSVAAGTGLTTDQTNAGPITSSGMISLANTAVTAGSYGDDGNTRTLSHGGTFKVPYYTVDAQGRLTASSTKTLTLPGSGNTIGKLIIGASTSAKADATTTNTTTFLNLIENNAVQSHHQISGSGATTVAFDTTNGLVISSTDQSVTSSANHYTPSTASGNDKTASASGGSASWSTSVVSGITINTDGKGHITGLSVSSVKTPADPGHYTANLIANTANNSTSNATTAITNGNLYLNLVENNTVRNYHKITGAGLVQVTRGASDNTITITDKLAVTNVDNITES